MALREGEHLQDIQTDMFPDVRPVSAAQAAINLTYSVYTLFNTPQHVKLHAAMEDSFAEGPHQPLQPALDDTLSSMRLQVLPQVVEDRSKWATPQTLTQLGGVLMQFGDYIPDFKDSIRIPYKKLTDMHEAVTAQAATTGPVGYTEQLNLALGLNDGNLPASLWQLFITSRMHARWLDSRIIDDMPDYTQEEKLSLMQAWRSSITACKAPDAERAQDPSGDAYYMWTHALAKVAFTEGPYRESAVSRSVVSIFERGTHFMHKFVHSVNRQGVQSDHSIAAGYGNAIGQLCVERNLKMIEA